MADDAISARAGGDKHPLTILDAAPLSTAQILALVLLAVISAMDGFDVLSVTFAASGVASEFGVERATLGVVLSAGLVGMALGSLFIAPFADVLGRRLLVLASLVLMSAGMFASATAADVVQLALWRVVTGLGIGAMVAVITPLAAEYANAKRRTFAVGLMAVGYPIGGVLGGSIAAFLLQDYGWRAVFVLGGVASLALIPLVLGALPESLSYLMERRPHNALRRVNAILAKFGHTPVEQLPASEAKPAKAPLAEIFSGTLLGRTLHITAVNFLFVMAVYYFLSWMPPIIVEAGFSPSQAAGASALANLAGVAGGLFLGWIAPRLGLKLVAFVAFAGMGVGTALFGLAADLAQLQLSAALTGFCLFGGIVAVYSIIAQSFPAHVRATGAGFVIGVGRGGSALAPVVAGLLFSAGVAAPGVSFAMGALAVAAGLGVLALRNRTS